MKGRKEPIGRWEWMLGAVCQLLGAHVPLSDGKHRGAAGVALPLLYPKPHPGAPDSAFDNFPAFGFKLFRHGKYHTDPYLMSQLE